MPNLFSRKATRLVTNSWSSLKRDYHYSKLTNVQIQEKRAAIYDKELIRQKALITDVEKIEVRYHGHPENCTLIMNKDISTPHNCAQHLHHRITEEAVLAEVDGDPWDMHRPLIDDCKLRILHFREADPFYVNKAFWRSLSFMLGSVIENAFQDSVDVQLCSFPSPNVRTGSFVYDVGLSLANWVPTKDELRVFSADMIKLSLSDLPINRLEVDASVALTMFEDNKYKREQIPHMAGTSKSGSTICVYRVGNFFDVSKGPMMNSTKHLGKCTITGAYPLESCGEKLYRFQGVGLPKDFMLSHFAYSILEDRARNLNSGRLPSIQAENDVEHVSSNS